MEHFKDFIRLVPGNGATDRADHAAMRPVTPYDSLAWTTAVAIVRERMERANEHVHDALKTGIWFEYRRGRYEAFRDILAEMEERGKP